MTKLQVFTSSIVVTSFFILVAGVSIYLSLTFNLLLVAEYLSSNDKIIFFVSVYFNLLYFSTFITVLSSAYYQLHALNVFLRKLKSDRKNLTTVQLIKRTAIMFDRFCDMFEDISRFYLLNIVIFLFLSAFFVTYMIYAFYLNFKNPNEFLLAVFVWMFYFLPPSLCVAVFASWIDNEGKKTGHLILSLVHSERLVKVLKSSNILMQQFKHHQPEISCGLFYLNWKFFFYVLGVISSFAIILIQFFDVSSNKLLL